ncbi:hypothetical protein [Tenacibaculum sp. nBUS_03]|uniref:hypothetical protein n=1 Tax=Tenacibaculum sp. nBUS_03 TaxID=3395320 RepID=UPI003EBF8021
MIVFYGDNFELNLTKTKVTLIEENPLFYDYIVKKYSWPFSKHIDDDTLNKLGFLGLENAANYQTRFYGNLLIDNRFEKAYFIITDFRNKTLKGTLYYGAESIALLDVQLKNLPFSVIQTNSLAIHAKETITKSYPETGYNFPMVIDENFKSKSKYEAFKGVINNYKDGYFITNSNAMVDGVVTALNKNILVPYPYLMEILKVGFSTENIMMQGSFVSDKANEKLMVYTDSYLEKFSSDLPDGFQFTTTSEFFDKGIVTATFNKPYQLNQKGSYAIDLFFNIPNELKVKEFSVAKQDQVYFTSTSNVVNESFVLNIENIDDYGYLNFKLTLEKTANNPSDGIGNISGFNNFRFDLLDGSLNEFPKSFSLAEVMPDMTFGSLLNKLKNWLNLEITFNKNVVTIDYIEDKFLSVPLKDETHLEEEIPHIKFNQNKIYKLVHSLEEKIISKKGVVNDTVGYRKKDIIEIPSQVSMLPVVSKDDIFTAKIEETEGLQLFLYNGLKDEKPLAVSSLENRKFNLSEIYNRYWKKWLTFRLNSETIKDKFKTDELEEFNISGGRFKYNKKQLYKKIKKTRNSENQWSITIESESF